MPNVLITICYATLQKKREEAKKIIFCKYCESDIASKNFTRHLSRNHMSESEVDNIFQYPKNTKERKTALTLLRNSTHFDLFVQGVTRLSRQRSKDNSAIMPCAYCRGLFSRTYLKRHAKQCYVAHHVKNRKSGKINHLSNSQTIVACAMDPTDTISRLNVKEQVSLTNPVIFTIF